MSSGREVRFRKKLVLSVLAATFLAGWVVAPIKADARIQQRVDIAADGTVYQFLCSDQQPAGTVTDRMTNVSMAIAFSPTSAGVASNISQGNPLISSVPATPLVALAQAKRSGILSLADCSPTVTFTNTGSGSWTSGGNTFAGFGAAGLTLIGSASPAASITSSASCGSSVYGFGGTATCQVSSPFAFPSDGFTLGLNQGILFVYNGSTFVPANTAGNLNVAGGGAGFDANASALIAATQDTDSIGQPITTTTTSSTSSTTSTSSSTTSTSSSTTTTSSTSTTSTTAPTIPTAGNWSMIILGLALLGSIAWMLQARRSLR